MHPLTRFGTASGLRKFLGDDWWNDPLFGGELDIPYGTLGGLWPPVDIYHDSNKVTVRVELPGVKIGEVDIGLEGDLLTISGEKKHAGEQFYHRVESACGRFSRSVTLPTAVVAEKIEADLTDGVLLITLPILEGAKPKQIPIKVKTRKK